MGCEEQNDCRAYAGTGKYGKRFAAPPKQKLWSFRGTGESVEKRKLNASAMQRGRFAQ